MTKKFRITVLGDGGWGTALACVNCRRKNEVLLWSAFADYAKILEEKRENTKFLPGIPLPSSLQITSDLSKAVAFAEIIILAIPAQYLRNILFKIKDLEYADKVFVSVAKGIEKKTMMRPSEVIRNILGRDTRVVALSGPSHAEEVVRNIPTLVVVASDIEKDAALVQSAVSDTCFRVYLQTDMIGVEFGGAVKNVIAIAAGVSDGLGFGDNTKSGMISRGLQEMVRLGIRYGANPNTFYGLSGLGDLITTCFSPHGRNLRVGREIGKGRKLCDVLANMEMVAEGVDTAVSTYEISEKLQLDLPIMREVYRMLYEDKDPRKAVLDLLNRPTYQELKKYDVKKSLLPSGILNIFKSN